MAILDIWSMGYMAIWPMGDMAMLSRLYGIMAYGLYGYGLMKLHAMGLEFRVFGFRISFRICVSFLTFKF